MDKGIKVLLKNERYLKKKKKTVLEIIIYKKKGLIRIIYCYKSSFFYCLRGKGSYLGAMFITYNYMRTFFLKGANNFAFD